MPTLSEWLTCTDRNGQPLPVNKREKCNQYRALHGMEPLPPVETMVRKARPVRSTVIEKKTVSKDFPAYSVCIHRGEQVDAIGCGSCSIDKRIFTCLHPENAGKQCIKRCPGGAAQKFKDEVAAKGLIVCELCPLAEKESE